MPTFERKLFNIVVLGRHNPQILSHDFLINNQILPTDREPFKALLKNVAGKGDPFTRFISTPPLTLIQYGPINMTVEETRFQIVDESAKPPAESSIAEIVTKYFSVLRHTPVTIGGFNFGGVVTFGSGEEERYYDDFFLAHRSDLCKMLETKDVKMTLKLEYPWRDDGLCRFEIARVDGTKPQKQLTLNYEFKIADSNAVAVRMKQVGEVHEYFGRLLGALLTVPR